MLYFTLNILYLYICIYIYILCIIFHILYDDVRAKARRGPNIANLPLPSFFWPRQSEFAGHQPIVEPQRDVSQHIHHHRAGPRQKMAWRVGLHDSLQDNRNRGTNSAHRRDTHATVAVSNSAAEIMKSTPQAPNGHHPLTHLPLPTSTTFAANTSAGVEEGDCDATALASMNLA